MNDKLEDKTENPGHQKEKPYKFFVDGVKYETPHSTLLGSQIKAMVPGLDPSFGLVLESEGHEPDANISDTTTVTFDEHKPLKFETVPPATFG